MARVLIVSFSEIRRDPRVRRQLSALHRLHEVTVAGLGPYQGVDAECVEIQRKKRPRRQFVEHARAGVERRVRLLLSPGDAYSWYLLNLRYQLSDAVVELSRRGFDLVVANDIDSLPFAFRVSGSSPVVIDAHEYAPGQFDNRIGWRLFTKPSVERLCRQYLPRCSGRMTVSESLAELYRKRFGVEFEVVTNATAYVEQTPSPVQRDAIRLVHHGAAIRSRRIDKMIRMMDFLPATYRLDLILVRAESDYLSTLKRMAARRGNVRVLDPVPPDEIAQRLNGYDIGVYIMQGSSTNNRNGSPNKMYEFVQARLCLAVSPSVEMKKLVDQWRVGVVSSDFSPRSMASAIGRLTPEAVASYKMRSHEVARDLSDGPNLDKIRNIVSALVALRAR